MATNDDSKKEIETYEFLANVVQNLPMGVAIVEPPNYVYYKINTYLAAINGVGVEEHIGRTIAEVLPDAAPFIVPRLDEVLKTGKASSKFEFEAKLPGKNETRLFEDVFVPVKGKDGQIIAIVANVFEVTELKKAQENLKMNVESLEQFNKLATGRELKMIELKDKIKELENNNNN